MSLRRLWINLLVLAVMMGALALAPEAEANGPCQNAGCSGWECIEWNNNYCMRMQNCCVCTCGAYACQYFDRGYMYIA